MNVMRWALAILGILLAVAAFLLLLLYLGLVLIGIDPDLKPIEIVGLLVYVVSESGTKWAFKLVDTLKATTLLPGGSIIVPSFL